MPTRTDRVAATPGFIADPPSIDHGEGKQIDWANVPVAWQDDEGQKFIPAGTVMAVPAGGTKMVPRVDRDVVANPTETAVGLLASSAREGEKFAALSGYGLIIGGVVYENLLPDDADAEWADGTIPAELQAFGTGFTFRTYSDSR